MQVLILVHRSCTSFFEIKNFFSQILLFNCNWLLLEKSKIALFFLVGFLFLLRILTLELVLWLYVELNLSIFNLFKTFLLLRVVNSLFYLIFRHSNLLLYLFSDTWHFYSWAFGNVFVCIDTSFMLRYMLLLVRL